MGRRGWSPDNWWSGYQTREVESSVSQSNNPLSSTGKLCCIYMKYDEEKSSPCWHPYRYEVTDSSVIKSRQIFFTLSPDGLTQFALDNTTFIDLNR